MNKDLSVISYNMGAGLEDYKLVWDSIWDSSNDSTKIKLTDYDYKAVELELKRILEKRPAHVYCLQNFQRSSGENPLDRSLITHLKTKKFVIVEFTGNDKTQRSDAVIALDPDRFSNIINYSISKSCAIVTATDTLTNKTIAFASSHMTGFKYTETTQALTDDYKNKYGPCEGDVECTNLKTQMDKLDTDLKVIGADTNDSPEKWVRRFNILTQSFQLFRTNEPTTIIKYKDMQNDIRVELDYFFVKKKMGVWARFCSLFMTNESTIRKIPCLAWWNKDTMYNNPSNHQPICLILTEQNKWNWKAIVIGSSVAVLTTLALAALAIGTLSFSNLKISDIYHKIFR